MKGNPNITVSSGGPNFLTLSIVKDNVIITFFLFTGTLVVNENIFEDLCKL